jgi:hypothetical protein
MLKAYRNITYLSSLFSSIVPSRIFTSQKFRLILSCEPWFGVMWNQIRRQISISRQILSYIFRFHIRHESNPNSVSISGCCVESPAVLTVAKKNLLNFITGTLQSKEVYITKISISTLYHRTRRQGNTLVIIYVPWPDSGERLDAAAAYLDMSVCSELIFLYF